MHTAPPTCPSLRHAAEHDGVYEIDPAALDRLGPIRIIDVREPAEFDGDLGHIDDAELVPLATVPTAMRNWDKSTPMVLVCRSGRRSESAVRLLMAAGFRCVINLRGGMTAYVANHR